MSDYEERVRFHLERMIQGKRVFVRAEARQLLAEYLTYKMMVLDWEDGEPIMPPEWPREFYRSQAIPPKTALYIARCVEGPWQRMFRTVSIRIVPERLAKSELLPVKNTKSFAIGFGNLFVFAFFTTQDLDFDLDWSGSFRLWPMSGVLNWPMNEVVDSSAADYVSETLARLANNPDVISELRSTF
jgi:hypothetical protein